MERYGYVYKIHCKITDMDYIGLHRTKEFDRAYWGSGNYIQNAVKKYGRENFEREVLCWAIDNEDLNSLEYQMIIECNTMYPNGYNLVEGGCSPKKSEEALKNNGKPCSEETKRKIGQSNKGRKRTQEQKDLIRKRTIEKMKEMKNPEKLKSCLGAHWYTNGSKNACLFECPDGWWRGKTVSKETREKIGSKSKEMHKKMTHEQKSHLFSR